MQLLHWDLRGSTENLKLIDLNAIDEMPDERPFSKFVLIQNKLIKISYTEKIAIFLVQNKILKMFLLSNII